MTRLQHAIEAARRAVLARAGETPCPDRVGGSVQHHEHNRFDFPNDLPDNLHFDRESDNTDVSLVNRSPASSPHQRVPALPTARPVEPPHPTVRVLTPGVAAEGTAWAFCEPDELLSTQKVSPGAVKVYRVLHRIACRVTRARGYRFHPDVVTFHLPAVMVAALARYTTRHLRRLVAELKAAGLLAGGPHASRVGLRSLWDGTVWAVKVKPGEAVPVVTAEEWKHVWRPDFEAEVKGKRGAASTMSQLLAGGGDEGYIFEVVAQAAVVGVYAEQHPVEPSSTDVGEEDGPSSVQEVIYTLGSLPAIHARRRGEVVSRMGATLARHLNDSHSKRWYCGLIWQAWAGYVRGEGSLQALAAALARLDADLREGAPWRNPGAVLSARLKPA